MHGAGRSGFAVALLAVTSGCPQSAYCVDYGPNATVTSVCWDEGERRIQLASYTRMSYCTGSGEKRFAHARVDLRPDERACAAATRLADDTTPYELAEGCAPLFEDSSFPACQDCELRLRVGTTGLTLVFVADGDPPDGNQSPLVLHILKGGEDLMILDLDLGNGIADVTDSTWRPCDGVGEGE